MTFGPGTLWVCDRPPAVRHDVLLVAGLGAVKTEWGGAPRDPRRLAERERGGEGLRGSFEEWLIIDYAYTSKLLRTGNGGFVK